MDNQCKGDKQLQDFWRDLNKNNPAEYKAKIRAARIKDADAPDGTPGLSSLADRRKVQASLHHDVVIAASVKDKNAVQWMNREQYAGHLYREGDVTKKEDGRTQFDTAIRVPGALTWNDNGTIRLAVAGIPCTEGSMGKTSHEHSMCPESLIHRVHWMRPRHAWTWPR